MSVIQYGYCHCGCGRKTNISDRTRPEYGHIKGVPFKYLKNHSPHPGRTVSHGYILIKDHKHPYSNSMDYVPQHILAVEKVLGKYLPKNAVVHHIDGDRSNNQNNNLVICEDRNYHNRIHQRMRGLKYGGSANYLKCKYCKEYDDPENLYVYKGRGCHKKCRNKFLRESRRKSKNV